MAGWNSVSLQFQCFWSWVSGGTFSCLMFLFFGNFVISLELNGSPLLLFCLNGLPDVQEDKSGTTITWWLLTKCMAFSCKECGRIILSYFNKVTLFKTVISEIFCLYG